MKRNALLLSILILLSLSGGRLQLQHAADQTSERESEMVQH